MARKIDLTGQKFGRLTAVKRIGSDKNGRAVWLCTCTCGNETEVRVDYLKNGDTKSCGCLRKEIVQKNAKGNMTTGTYAKKYRKEGTDLNYLTQKTSSNNTSGVKGVSWYKQSQKWMAKINFKGKQHHLGYFVDKQEAINARKEAEEKYFKPILEKYDHTKKPTSVAAEVRQ